MPRLAAIAIALALVATSRAAEASPRGFKRVVVDHVEVMPSVLHGMVRLRVFVNAFDLETGGTVLDLAGDTKTKTVWTVGGNAAIKKIPYLAGRFLGSDDELAIALVIETSGEYANDLDTFKQAIHDDVLVPLEKREGVQVAVIGYGSEVTAGKLTSVKTAEGQLSDLGSDGTPTDAPALLEAIDKAVTTLKKAKPPSGASASSMRRLVIVVSDGRAAEEDRDEVTRAAHDADRAGIRIDSIAYAPNDVRPPLLALGELSKVSQGVFRWIRVFPALTHTDEDKTRKQDPENVNGAFKKLSDEIAHQYVLTMFVPIDDVPKKVSVTTMLSDRALTSQDVKLPKLLCADEECPGDGYCSGTRCVNRGRDEGLGIFGWLLIIAGILVGALAILVGAGFVITKLKNRSPKPAPVPGAVVPVAAPAPPAAPAEPGPGPKLYILSGPETGRRIALRHGFTIGKAPGSDLSLAHDSFASTNHAHILMDTGGNCQIIDQGSTNGTYINGVRITDSRLFDGMSIRCGSTELRFLAN